MAETQQVRIVQDGRSGTVDYPAEWTASQIDQHLKENNARRFTPSPGFGEASRVFNVGPVKVEMGASPLYNYVKNMSTTEKAIMLGTLPLGGPEIGLGIKALGGTVAGAGRFARLGSAGIQMAKGAVAGGTGAALEQQIGEEGAAPSVKSGMLRGFLTALGGESTQAVLNSMSKMLMGHITQSFVDGQSLKNFLTRLVPDLASAGQNPAAVFNEVFRGKIALTAQQEIQRAVEQAAGAAQHAYVQVPEFTKLLKATGLNLKYPSVDLQTGLMTVRDAMDIHASLAQFATREGAQLAGKSAALIQNIRDHAEGLINNTLGERAAGAWTAAKVRYGSLMRVHDFLTEKANDVMKASGVPDFEALQQKFLKDFAGDSKVQKLMGQVYEDLMQTVFRRGSVLVRDVPGYIPRMREAVGLHSPRAYLGVPLPAKLAGRPGEIPAGMMDPVAGLLAPSLPTSLSP